MPLTVRPYQPSDGAPLMKAFAADARAPWLRLPHPYVIEDLVVRAEGLTVWVADTGEGRIVGLVAIDRRGEEPLLIGPLVADDQLADLFGKALGAAALAGAAEAGLDTIRAKVDLGEDRGLAFFLNQGFRLLGTREYLLAARKGKRPAPEPPDGTKIGISPEMLSSDYQRLYAEIGGPLGWTDRAAWTRPQVFEHLQRPDVHLYAARTGDTYLGFAEIAAREPGEAEITHLGVLPAFRGRGVGGALLEHVVWHATEALGYERVWMAASTDESGRLAFDPSKHGLKQERALVHLEKRLAEVAEPRAAAP
jgi:GNAT superfamily N-acetyltransferase